MADLDTLRPEVRQAIEFLDRVPNNAWAIVRTDYARLLRRNAELEAKATRDHDWISDLLAENKKAEAELAEAQNTIAAQQGTMGALKRKLALAEGELAALKARIRGACLVPLTAVMLRDGYSLTVSGPMSVNDVDELAGKCVRLVVEE